MRPLLGLPALLFAATLVVGCSSADPTAEQSLPSGTPATSTSAAPATGDGSAPAVSCARLRPALADGTMRLTFDGDPGGPTMLCPDDAALDVQVHRRDDSVDRTMDPFDAHHGEDCSPYPATHLADGFDDALYVCRNHLMTALNAEGYGVIYFTPAAAVRIEEGSTTVVRWDVSTLRTSSRDWWDVWISPWNRAMALPLEADLPDLTGPPRDAIHVRLTTENAVCPELFIDGVNLLATESAGSEGCAWWRPYDEVLEPSATRRTTFELRLSPSHLAIGIPELDLWWFDAELPARVPFDLGVVQFGHHSYNPTKDGGTPSTWHWDNIEMTAAVSFTVMRAAEPQVVGDGTVTFAAPAAAGALLRFAANGGLVEVDDGTGWRAVSPLAEGDGFRQASFVVPVPPGTRDVRVRLSQAGSWYAGPFVARDFAVWSP